VLFQINVVNRSANSQNFGVHRSLKLLESCHEFPNDYEENGLQRAVPASPALANVVQLEIEIQSMKRVRNV
jgi:hypothetical protein